MAGFGLNRRRRRRGRSGAPAPALVPVGATFGYVGDGVMSQSAGGTRNMGDWFLALMGMRLQPVPLWNVAQSGTVIARTVGGNANVWINPHAVDALAAQKPDVAIFGTCGHNDGLKTADPDANPLYLNDWKNALARHIAGNPQALLIPVMTVWPSKLPAESAASSTNPSITVRRRVWDLQIAHVQGLAVLDPRLIVVDTSSVDPTVANDPGDTDGVHPDKDGGQTGGQLLYAAIGSRVAPVSPAQIQAMIDAGTYPLMGEQIDADRALAGTAGTATTGMQAGSQVATSKLASNATGGTVQAAVVNAGAYNKVVVTLSGTASADGIVVVQDKTALALSGITPGQNVFTGFGARIPAGLNRLGSDLASFGTTFDGSAVANDSVSDLPTTTALDTVLLTAPQSFWGTTTSIKRSLTLRYKSGTALSGTLEVYQPFAWIVRDRLRHAPVYLGNLKPAGSGGFLSASTQRLRPSGTVTAASGGTVRVEPGKWAPHGLTEADFSARRIYKGTAADTAIGAGVLLATLSGSAWSYAVPAGAAAAGDLIYVELDAANGLGGTVTARSSTTITVG